MTVDRDRHTRLEEIRLRGLVDRHGGDGAAAEVDVVETAAVAVTPDGRGWATITGEEGRGLGAAVVWCSRRDADLRTVFAAVAPGVIARRAGGLDPRPRILAVSGAETSEAVPDPAPAWPEPDAAMAALADVLAGAGLDVVVEQGTYLGEVDGLEVARITVTDTGPRIEVGVGRYDREVGVLLRGDRPRLDELARVAELVRRHRRAGADHHPVGALARERWLRSVLVRRPEVLGLDGLEPLEPVVARRGLRHRTPAAAVGTDGDGRRVLVLCSVGVDPELVAVAADHLVRDRPDRLMVVVPDRDVLAPIERALGGLAVPAELRGVVPPWDGTGHRS